MPFRSSKQQAWMEIHHPQIAKRWQAEFGNANTDSKSNEIVSPKKDRAARLPGRRRDFAALNPSQSARHTPRRANEVEAMSQGDGVSFQEGSRGRQFGRPERAKGLPARDVRVSTRKG